MNLVADIGGTKTLVALADAAGNLQQVERLVGDDYADFPALLTEYFQRAVVDRSKLSGVCLAVAGPIADARNARLTNRAWQIDAAALEQRFTLPTVKIVNDFAAAAMGVTVTPAKDLSTLQSGVPEADGVRLVLGAGTGLGVAVLSKQGERWRVLPGEGGHIAFAPQDEQQDKLCQWLRRQYGRVSNERLVSGAGLVAIYAFLHDQAGAATEGLTEDPATIATQAREGESMAQAAFDLFASIYGAVAGDLALLTLPRSGVYLAGGIAAKNLDLMQRSHFLAAFNAKGRHSQLAERMPVHVVTEPLLGLKGAAAIIV